MAKKTSKISNIDLLGGASLETTKDYYDAMNQGELDLAKLRKQISREIAQQQKKYMSEALAEEKKFRTDMNIESAEDERKYARELQAFRLKQLQEEEKEKKKRELARIAEVAKQMAKEEGKATKVGRRANRQEELKEMHDTYMSTYMSISRIKPKERTEEQKKAMKEANAALKEEARHKALNNTMNHLINSLDKLTAGIDKYATYSGKINARLQGYNTGASGWERFKTGVQTFGNQPFSILENRLTTAVGITPYFKTEVMMNNLQALVEAGIASNVEQRAFIQTAKDDIATTFDVANSSLLRIIRLQQEDSTAARLGMEAYLTRFLNELVSNTEYLNQTFDTVQESLLEASSIMKNAAAATELEFVVQKWLGALTGVGLSTGASQNIAQALGYLGSGNIEALGSSNLQNLLVMAASRKGISYSDLLTSGLTAQNADVLMRSIVEYMGEIGSSNNNVVKSQFAQTFGLTISDLKAAQQISSSLNDISGVFMSYNDMYAELRNQLNQIPKRLNMASMIDTVWSNLEWGLSSNIAKNPALSAIWKVTNLVQENTGGINIPFISAMGTGFDLNTTVENLVKLGVVGLSSLGMIGDLVHGIGNTFSPSSILGRLGIQRDKSTIVRGTVGSRYTGSLDTSLSAMVPVSTSSGEDIGESALATSKDKSKEEVKQSQEEQENPAKEINEYLRKEMITTLVGIKSEIHEVNEKMNRSINVNVVDLPDSFENSILQYATNTGV